MDYKKIKSLLLLSALSLCGQSSAMDVEDNDRQGMKRLLEKPNLSSLKNEYSFYGFPEETLWELMHFFDPAEDQKTLLALAGSCKKFNTFVTQKYLTANEGNKHKGWQDNLSLAPSTVYVLNQCVQEILGWYTDIQMDRADAVDRIRFERSCAHFQKVPYFAKDSIVVQYVDFLKLHLACTKPSQLQASLGNPLRRRMLVREEDCTEKFASIVGQENVAFQNETALYFHYNQFVLKLGAVPLANLKNSESFKQLDNSLMAVMADNLLALKATPGLSGSSEFVEIWEQIIALEPALTIYQLGIAAKSYSHAGFQVLPKDDEKFLAVEMYEKAIKYRKKKLNAIKAAGQSPTFYDYKDIADDYCYAVLGASDPLVKFKNFEQAASYCEEGLKNTQRPYGEYYEDTALAFSQIATNVAGPSVKAENIEKAIMYYEKAAKLWEEELLEDLKFSRITGLWDENGDGYTHKFNQIAHAFLEVADMKLDPLVKARIKEHAFMYYEKSTKYCEEQLKDIESPEYWDYNVVAEAYTLFAHKAVDPLVKAQNFEQAEKYKQMAHNLINKG